MSSMRSASSRTLCTSRQREKQEGRAWEGSGEQIVLQKNTELYSNLASVPGLPHSVQVLITHCFLCVIETRTE